MDSASKLTKSLPNFKNKKYQQLVIQLASIAVASSTVLYTYRLIAGLKKKKQGLKKNF